MAVLQNVYETSLSFYFTIVSVIFSYCDHSIYDNEFIQFKEFDRKIVEVDCIMRRCYIVCMVLHCVAHLNH
jgi:hypothetical protein